MNGQADIIVTEKADAAKQLELCWQCNSEAEANRMVQWLKDQGITAKAVSLGYCKDFS